MTSDYRIRLADWDTDQARLRDVRRAVFVEEQGIPQHLEWDNRDAGAQHVIAETTQGQAIATARLLDDGQIGRMAVLCEYRRRGIGRSLLEALIAQAKLRGFNAVFVNAQLSAMDFYSGCRFEAEGEPFLEAGISHQCMRLAVQ